MHWPMFLSTVFSGSVIWVLGLRLNRNASRKLVDEETDEDAGIDGPPTLFLVPLHYWGIIVVVLAVVVAFAE